MVQTAPSRDAARGWTTAAAFDEGLRRHMLQVYNYMGLGLVLTGLVAFVVASSPALVAALFGSPLMWVVMLAPLGFVFFLSWKIESISASTAQLLFWAFCVVMGLSMASVFLRFTDTSIARVFFVSAATFGAASLYGYTTKADLSKFGSFLLMGLIGILIAMVVNIFLASSALQFAVSAIGVVVFTGLAAYDTQAIKEAYTEHAGSETNNKLAVMGALSLYLSFINLFHMLLYFLGDQEG